jgi:peptidoglycan LD-endopeptidase CwlK
MLTDRDRQRMAGVHSDLVRLVEAASNAGVKFTVIEGVRTLDRQKKLFAERKTQTMRSRHLTGHAIDIAPLADTDGDGDTEPSWYWPDYYAMAPKIKAIAGEIGVRVEWGGDWTTFKDGPHWQIPWSAAPAVAVADSVASEPAPQPIQNMQPERGTLKVDGARPVEVVLPEMKPSPQTGEWRLTLAGMLIDTVTALAPIILQMLDPAMDQIQTKWFPVGTAGGLIFAAIRTAYKGWRTQAAVKVASAEVAR